MSQQVHKVHIKYPEEIRYSYNESQVRSFPEGQRKLKKSERLSKKGARRAKA